jgi:hypothetical protein
MIEPNASCELYESHGREPSQDEQVWLRAEQAEQDWLRAEQAEQILIRNVNGITSATPPLSPPRKHRERYHGLLKVYRPAAGFRIQAW